MRGTRHRSSRIATSRRGRLSLFVVCAAFAALFFLAGAGDAKANTVRIDNHKREKVKVCVYRSTDKTWLNPLRCWTLMPDESVDWNRGSDTFSIDVRVFRPALVDKQLCQIQSVGDISHLYINPLPPCITFMKRAKPVSRDTVPVKVWKIGSKVLVNKNGDNFWYPATVIRANRGLYRVRYAKGGLELLGAQYISGDYVRLGTRISGDWKNGGRYYPGRISSRTGDRVSISYDDGDKESTTLAYIRLSSGDLPKPPLHYTLRVCNSQEEKVFFSISFAIDPGNFATEGWWFVNPKGCFNVDLEKRWKMAGVPANVRSKTYIYGETKGILGGAIKKSWEGTDKQNEFCVNVNKDNYFKNLRYVTVNGNVKKNACQGSGQELLKMNELSFRGGSELVNWRF